MQFIDGIVKAFVLSLNKNPELFHLVKTYQVHSHSQSCRKYKNENLCDHFRNFFADHTIASVPLQDDLPEQQKKTVFLIMENNKY